MTVASYAEQDAEGRARLSLGASNSAILNMVARALDDLHVKGNVLLDVGCGRGDLRSLVSHLFKRYIGIDAVRYEGFPDDVQFERSDLNTSSVLLPDGTADVVVSVET